MFFFFVGDYQGTTEMEECLERLKVTNHNDAEETAKMDKLQEEYERSIQHTSQIPPYGIEEVSKICQYPIEYGGKVKTGVCREEIERKKPRLCK